MDQVWISRERDDVGDIVYVFTWGRHNEKLVAFTYSDVGEGLYRNKGAIIMSYEDKVEETN